MREVDPLEDLKWELQYYLDRNMRIRRRIRHYKVYRR